MCKKIMTYVTLISFLNQLFLYPAVIANPHQPIQDDKLQASDKVLKTFVLQQNERKDFLFPMDQMLSQQADQVTLTFEDTLIAYFIKTDLGYVFIQHTDDLLVPKKEGDIQGQVKAETKEQGSTPSKIKGAFIFQDLQKIEQFRLKSEVPVVFEEKVHFGKTLILESPFLEFQDGFVCDDPDGVVVLNSPEIHMKKGDFKAGFLNLKGVDDFDLHPHAFLTTKYVQVLKKPITDSPLCKITVMGKWDADTVHLTGPLHLLNKKGGAMQFHEGAINITSIGNEGQLTAPLVQVNKTFSNQKSGVFTSTKSLQIKGDRFDNIGILNVYGLASVQVKDGDLRGVLNARKATLSFEKIISLCKGASFIIQDHLTFHSEVDLGLYGNIIFGNLDCQFPCVKLSDQEKRFYNTLQKGAFLTAKRDISKTGRVDLVSGKVLYSAGRHYKGEGGNTEIAFKNSIAIISKTASLFDEMTAQDLSIMTFKRAHLKGLRHIKNTFFLKTADLCQWASDHLQAQHVAFMAQTAIFAGNVQVGTSFQTKASTSCESRSSFSLKAVSTGKDQDVSAVIQAPQLKLSGLYQGVDLKSQAEKSIVLTSQYQADLSSAQLESDSITHQKGSSHKVQKINKETARQHITVENGASLDAKDHLFDAGQYIWNAGNIHASHRYVGDTKYHYNLLGASIKAPHATIFADYLNLNMGGVVWSNHLDINTLCNINGGILRGGESLEINSFANLGAGLSMSCMHHVNAGFNIEAPWALHLPDLASPSNILSSVLTPYTITFDFVKSLVSKPVNTFISIGFLIYEIGFFAGELYEMYHTESTDYTENYWRPSRMVARIGTGVDLGSQAYKHTNTLLSYVPTNTQPKKNNDVDETNNNADNTLD